MLRSGTWIIGSLALMTGLNSSPVPTVHMRGSLFDPAALTVKVGQKVLFVNDDPFVHNVTDADDHVASGDIAAKTSWSSTFDQPGVYRYVCTYHPWMKGQITVAGSP